jgi:hypothetical protein
VVERDLLKYFSPAQFQSAANSTREVQVKKFVRFNDHFRLYSDEEIDLPKDMAVTPNLHLYTGEIVCTW